MGPGCATIDIIFASIFPDLQKYHMIEPNKDLYNAAKANIKNEKNQQLYSIDNCDFNSFDADVNYDLIFFSHSLYYLGNVKKVLQRCKSIAKQIVIFHQTPVGINYIQHKFGDEQTIKFKLSSDGIINALKFQKHKFDYDQIPSNINVNNPDKKLIDFFLEKEASSSEYSSLKEHLKKYDGMMPQPTAVIVSEL